jgi:hypothetical protein
VVAFGLIWFLASILPVAFLPQHVASYYASVGAAGVSLALVSLVLGESRWPAFRAAAFAVAGVRIFSHADRCSQLCGIFFLSKLHLGSRALAAKCGRHPETVTRAHDRRTG